MTTAAPPADAGAPPTTGLSRTAGGPPRPPWPPGAGPAAGVASRTRSSAGRPASASALLALFLRLWHLGTPHGFEFDETYYAKDAWSLLHFGYVQEYVGDANDQILDGTVDRAVEGRARR